MKKQSKRFVSLALVLALVLVPTAALAADAIKKQMIEANYMGIKLVVNGIEVTPTDAAGHAVEPFASNGTTYLPVRAVAAALGQDVEWDGETKTVYIGDNIPGKETNWMQKLPPYQLNSATAYDGSDHTKYFTVAGNKQPLGVTFTNKVEFYGRTEDGRCEKQSETTSSALWNTNCAYKTMNFTVGHMGDKEVDFQLEVYLDGVYSQTIEVPWDVAPKTVSIPLNYAPSVKLQFVAEETGPEWDNLGSNYQNGLYDISFE